MRSTFRFDTYNLDYLEIRYKHSQRLLFGKNPLPEGNSNTIPGYQNIIILGLSVFHVLCDWSLKSTAMRKIPKILFWFFSLISFVVKLVSSYFRFWIIILLKKKKKKHIKLDCQRHLAQFSLAPKLSFAREKSDCFSHCKLTQQWKHLFLALINGNVI